jgi:dTDP-4-amino-4,6-dideoxygalactose transaminase
LLEEAVNERTRVVIATHLFGYAMDVDRLRTIVRAAEVRYGRKIWIVQDCAHSFGARWHGKAVTGAGDVALYGLNISKTVTSIFGGMLTLDDEALAERLRNWRDLHFTQPGILKELRRLIYFLATYPAFNESLYGLVYWLQLHTPFLKNLTDAYHLDDKIHFPPDYLEQISVVEAKVGRAQLRKYDAIIARRREHARYYDAQLRGRGNWVLPPLVEGATFSHYAVRVHDRDEIMRRAARRGIQLGRLIEYSVPHLDAYRGYTDGKSFPNALMCSGKVLNLPVYTSLSATRREHVVQQLLDVAGLN